MGILDQTVEKVVFISDEQLHCHHESTLRGRYHKDTGIFNVYPPELAHTGDLLGSILPLGSAPGRARLTGVLTDDGIEFFSYGAPVRHETYSLYQDVFSRNRGILESDVMANSRAVILGCGSVGSLVALELARAGVGHFVLCDADVVEYHNLCRHQCGIDDVGGLKVNAIAKKIRNINPKAEVNTFAGIVQNLPKTVLDDFCCPGKTVFVGCADNRAADVFANRIAAYFGSAFLSIGFWERAYAGELFYHIPGKSMPCYGCALGDGSSISARAQANHHVYSTQESNEGLKFEPGISVDINFVTSIGIKLALDILNLNNDTYIPRLLGHLQQYTLVCNTSDPKIGGEMVEIFSYPLQVTTSLQVRFGPGCSGKCQNED